MPSVIKVTAFVVRHGRPGDELLLFRHPQAGVQIPAGTAEQWETPEVAVMREAGEETGLTSLMIRKHLGAKEETFGEHRCVTALPTTVYARPESASAGWASLPRGVVVRRLQEANRFVQVAYEELDRLADPQYVSMSITGWVPQGVLAKSQTRHFFLLDYAGPLGARWTVHADYHRFELFWAPLKHLPAIVAPQDTWLGYLFRGLA